jgi:hypothetical protein
VAYRNIDPQLSFLVRDEMRKTRAKHFFSLFCVRTCGVEMLLYGCFSHSL